MSRRSSGQSPIVDTITIPPSPTGPMMNITPGFNLDDKVSVETLA